VSGGEKKYYITTAIDYANGLPHLGHALEKIGADVVARYRRRRGLDVHFVMGMDEHGQKVVDSARDEGVTPQDWVDGIAEHFAAAWERLQISNDDFIRTTEERHHRAVREMIRRLGDAGDLYAGTYEGWYCVGCEVYKGKDDLEDGPDGDLRCPVHPSRKLEWMEEENWFFRLSRYQDPLLELLDRRPEFVLPETRRNEVRRVIEGGLDDISVSRSALPWGVPWPGEEGQTVYVWLDALTNYLSAVGFPEESYRRYWPADVHVIGKDITRFHCIYWPAFLLSAGVELPRTVWAHGFVGYGGHRLSKSEGVAYDLDDAIEQHGPEPLRYYLLREVPWDGDGEITRERYDERYTAELANDLGNLASRVLAMIERYRDGVVPSGRETRLREGALDAIGAYSEAMDAHLLHRGIEAARELTAAANVFVEEQSPWELVRDEGKAEELDATLADLAWVLAVLATLHEPFLPGRMRDLAGRVGLDGVPELGALEGLNLADHPVRRGEPLFPRPDR